MTYTTQVLVRFAHVDAAAIVFYPRYFEMLNGVVEDWFADMGWDFQKMHVDPGMGVPTVKLDCEFVSPSALGDVLTVSLTPTRVGNSSCTLSFTVVGGGEERLRATVVLVCMDLAKRKSHRWPEELRLKMTAEQAPAGPLNTSRPSSVHNEPIR